MRVLVLHSQVPFVQGGAENLVSGLCRALTDRGHEADIVSIPYRWNPPDQLLRSAVAWRMIDLTEVAGREVDLVVCTKFPTWAVKHPRKVLWLVHQHRQAYDLYGTAMSELGPDRDSQAIRESILQVDRIGIGECQPRFAISRNVADRLRQYSAITSEVLYPPVDTLTLRTEAYEPFVLSPSRLDEMKRVRELITAWPHVDPRLRLIVASDGPLRPQLELLVKSLGMLDRVSFVGRISEEQLADLYRRCRAVYFAPIDEDFGYVTVEAHAAGKPVITSQDSGGVLEFVQHSVNGLVTELTPRKLAATINLYADEAVAIEHGMCGAKTTTPNTWDAVVSSLVERTS